MAPVSSFLWDNRLRKLYAKRIVKNFAIHQSVYKSRARHEYNFLMLRKDKYKIAGFGIFFPQFCVPKRIKINFSRGKVRCIRFAVFLNLKSCGKIRLVNDFLETHHPSNEIIWLIDFLIY